MSQNMLQHYKTTKMNTNQQSWDTYYSHSCSSNFTIQGSLTGTGRSRTELHNFRILSYSSLILSESWVCRSTLWSQITSLKYPPCLTKCTCHGSSYIQFPLQSSYKAKCTNFKNLMCSTCQGRWWAHQDTSSAAWLRFQQLC